jgi:hypothetical protein
MGFGRETDTMNDLLNKFAQGLPALLGVIGGIYIFYLNGIWLILPIVVYGLAWLLMTKGSKLLGTRPFYGWILIELWVFAAISILAISTIIILWLTVNADSLAPVSSEIQKTVSGALVGAVSAFFAILWTKDIESGKGYFWPNSKFKQALKDHFKKLNATEFEELYYAVYNDVAFDKSFEGWGFIERKKRALIVESHLSKQ